MKKLLTTSIEKQSLSPTRFVSSHSYRINIDPDWLFLKAEKVEALIRDKAVSRQKVSEKFNEKVQIALAQRQQQ